MRVLHFYKTYFPDTVGGVEQAISHLARGAGSFGCDVNVLSLTPDRLARTVDLENHRAYRARLDFQIASTGFSASAFLRFAQLAKDADVIHYHFPWPFMDLVHFATRVNKPSVVTYHSDIIRQKRLLALYRPLQYRFLASVDRIVASSPNYFATSEVLQRFSKKVSVIPLGIDRASYLPPSEEKLAHWKSRFPTRFFLFVGLLRYYKGLHILLEAARNVDYPIGLVGAGPIEGELKAKAAKLGLSNVHFLGQIPDEDKIALLTLCHAVVFPSHLRSEAFGISLLEGAMFGKPMISSEIGTGTTFINIDGETGIVVPPSDSGALRQAMQWLWQHDDAARAMGHRAERRYWELFTADRMVSQYVRLYGELVASRLPTARVAAEAANRARHVA